MAVTEEATIHRSPGGVGMAVAVIIYTLGSAFAAIFTYILFRLNNKNVAYVSLICLSVFLQQVFTVAQEVVSLSLWPQTQVEEYKFEISQWRNPNASIGYQSQPNLVIRVLFGFRMYFFNVESLLFIFWTLMLFVSVWEIHSISPKTQRFVAGTKWFSFVLPAIQVILDNIPAVTKIPILAITLGNFIMVLSLPIGCVLLLLIIYRCVKVMWTNTAWKQKLRQWQDADRGNMNALPNGNSELRHSNSRFSGDQYVILRFVLGFITISLLQLSFLLTQVVFAQQVWRRMDPNAPEPIMGMTPTKQLGDWAYYFVAASTGFLALAVFGTTQESRLQIRGLNATWRNQGLVGVAKAIYSGNQRQEAAGSNSRVPSGIDDEHKSLSPTRNMEERSRVHSYAGSTGSIPLTISEDQEGPIQTWV